MRILITNDDGIDAPGLEALRAAVGCLAGEIVVAAPALPHSGCGHRVTTDRPIRVAEVGPGRYRVEGTPADCVRIALARIVPDAALVVSGINAGGNLGADVHHSGTVAAAREAALHGLPALAASHYHRRGTTIDWGRAVSWVAEILRSLPDRGHEPGTFWNVNLPDLPAAAPAPGVVECQVDASPFDLVYRLDTDGWHYESSYHERPRLPGGDIDVCFAGGIALSRLRTI